MRANVLRHVGVGTAYRVHQGLSKNHEAENLSGILTSAAIAADGFFEPYGVPKPSRYAFEKELFLRPFDVGESSE